MSKTGYCSVCHRDDIKRINQAIRDGWSYAAVRDVFEAPPAKATFFKHKEHVTAPLLTEAEAARKNPIINPKNNKEVLEAIRDIGLRNAMENPEKITPSHALRAASILSEKEGKTETIHVVLAKLLQQDNYLQLETVKGDYGTTETD